jgi:hypothetical protein
VPPSQTAGLFSFFRYLILAAILATPMDTDTFVLKFTGIIDSQGRGTYESDVLPEVVFATFDACKNAALALCKQTETGK